MFRNLLIANRGEIARRVARTCRSMGVGVATVYSDPDRDALHVREADAAVRLPGSASADTYLRADLLVEAATLVGADALHPGYGFLAENAGLARRCAQAGITFVGPSPEAIETMGRKLESKRLVSAAGVAVLPTGIVGPATSSGPAGTVGAAAQEVGFPLLVKANAGGGGKAMRLVRGPDDLAAAVDACRREAASAFADDVVFLERYVESSRHVEVQVFGDGHGNVVHLFERECSIQRRYQKVIEEAPSPAVPAGLRRAMGEAAVTVARAIGYTGAGTVEFLLEPEGRFWFLEMNTRLQVEHPVTELTTGLDLVALQLLVAAGEPLPPEALDPCQQGHAVEARLYAEDPERGYLPVAGRIEVFDLPAVPGVRVDAGVAGGSEVPIHYDPLLAKVIAHGPTREVAVDRLAAALAGARVHGVATNRDLLVAVLRHPEFRAGTATTAFLDTHPPASLTAAAGRARLSLHAVAAALAAAAGRRGRAPVLWSVPSGFRNNRSQPQRETFQAGGERIVVEYAHLRPGTGPDRRDVPVEVAVDGTPLSGFAVHEVSPGDVDLTVAGVRQPVTVAFHGETAFVDSPLGSDDLLVVPRFPEPAAAQTEGALVAPMPGLVVRVHVEPGEMIGPDDPLVVLEAMKMEHTVRAVEAGKVAEIRVAVGDQVVGGDVVAVVA